MDNKKPMKMEFKLLQDITDGFSTERMIGRGTFGVVYKGIIEDSEEVIAVKLLKNPMQEVDDEQFGREFNNLTKLRHPNIVKLLGYCDEIEKVSIQHNEKTVTAEKVHRALCLEYMANGSLQDHLSDIDQGLDWRTRYKIIKGICEGLNYLHTGLESPVYHLDLKPANVLLDGDMVPKIADFGLSRLLGEESTKMISNVGTLGYLPPEYITNQVISKEFDIFSLGVITMKIIIGSVGYSVVCEMEPTKVIEYGVKKWKKRLQVEQGSFKTECHQIRKCIEIALRCTDVQRRRRPAINYIVNRLNETEKLSNEACSRMEEVDQKSDYQESSIRNSNLEGRHSPGSPSSNPLLSNIDPIIKLNAENVIIDNLAVGKQQGPIVANNSVLNTTIEGTPLEIITAMPTSGISSEMTTDASRDKSLPCTLPEKLPLQFLTEITDNFSDERKLSSSAFGTDYKGVLQDGQVIIVKRINDCGPVPAEKQIILRMPTYFMVIEHENILKLLSYCIEGQKKVVEHNGKYIIVDTIEFILCYEYASMGSIDKYIFGDTNSQIDWCARFKIIMGICKGLHFLHKELGNNPIVHLDLQPANILLDDNKVAKIANFGLSRLFGEEQTRINTINVVGAKGYMAPEYLYRGEISTRSDIYSLGVLIIEISTGEKNCSNKNNMSSRDFIDRVRQTWTDEHIATKYLSLDVHSLDQVKTCIELGLMCVNIDQNKRPSILQIVDKLCQCSVKY